MVLNSTAVSQVANVSTLINTSISIRIRALKLPVRTIAALDVAMKFSLQDVSHHREKIVEFQVELQQVTADKAACARTDTADEMEDVSDVLNKTNKYY